MRVYTHSLSITHTHTYICVYTWIYMYIILICIYVYTSISLWIVCMHIYMYIHIYVYRIAIHYDMHAIIIGDYYEFCPPKNKGKISDHLLQLMDNNLTTFQVCSKNEINKQSRAMYCNLFDMYCNLFFVEPPCAATCFSSNLTTVQVCFCVYKRALFMSVPSAKESWRIICTR